ncbi:MAG: S-layer homology domain-containing protein, partial [Clostridia bacterium]|nr:S-layer homology domain-containing protein [Clostridia bacterium]
MKKIFSCLLLCTLLCALPAHAAYADVPEGEWYQPYVTELSAQGVISGYEDGSFRPDGTVTWGEALKLIL